MTYLRILLVSLLFIALATEAAYAQLPGAEGRRLRDIVEEKYSDGELLIGSTTGSWAFGSQLAELLDREYSYVTPENDFKQSVIRSDPNAWNWSRADAWLQHIIDNGQVLRIHGPIGPQCNTWAKEDNRTAEELAEEMDTFMTALCMRYNGVEGIEYLDVVNEIALDDGSWFGPKGGTDSWENPWTRIGYDTDANHTPLYIRRAFAIANEHATDLKLVLNNHCPPGSAGMEKVKQAITYLLDLGYRVDAMGWQAHVDVGWESEENLQALAEAIDWCQERDIEFHITEFDAYIQGTYYPTLEMQANTYASILDVMLSRQDSVVMGWNSWHISDARGWKPEKRPALFDDNYAAKPAYYAFQLAMETRGSYDTPLEVAFKLEAEESGLPLEGCKLEINGESLVSDVNGRVVLEAMNAGRYELLVRSNHRDTVEKKVSIYRDTLITLSMTLYDYPVSFSMSDSHTGNPLSGVVIRLGEEEGISNVDGKFDFRVPFGSYETVFSKEGYRELSEQLDVSGAMHHERSMEKTHAQIKFRLKTGSTPVNGALVVLGEDSLTSSLLGICTFTEREVGADYDYSVSRTDYFPLAGGLRLNADTTLDLQLRKAVATLSFQLDEASMDAENAFLVLGSDTALFSAQGSCKFYKLSVDAQYDYLAGSDNYPDLEGNLFLEKDSTVLLSLSVDGVEDQSSSDILLVYPVPASDVLYVSSSDAYSHAEVYDLCGSLHIQMQLNKSESRIPLTSLHKGCYLLRLLSPDGEHLLRRFLVQ